MMENWVLNLLIAISGVAGTYAVLQHRVKRLEDDKKETDLKINEGFKRLDTVIDRIIILEQTTKEHLGLREAEDKFVSHRELQLYLTNIEKSIQNVEKNSDVMTKKLEELTAILSNNIVKTLSAKGGQ